MALMYGESRGSCPLANGEQRGTARPMPLALLSVALVVAGCTGDSDASDGSGIDETSGASTSGTGGESSTEAGGEESAGTSSDSAGDGDGDGDGDSATSGDGDGNTNTDTDTSGPGDGDGDCEWEGIPAGSTVSLDLDVDGVARTFSLHLPADFDCTPRPLVMGLHGYYGSGAGFESSTSDMGDRIDELGYIGIFPDGLPMSNTGWQSAVTSFNDVDSHQSDGPDGPTCTQNSYDYDVYDNCRPEESQDLCNWGTSCADDEAFFRALIARATSQWAADPGRVLLTGFSQGGQTTQAMAWRMSDVVTVASPHHGFAANGYTQAPTTPMSLFQVWASDDTVVDGNDVPSSDGMIYDGADETLAVWGAAQGCDAATSPYPTGFDGTSGWDCTQYDNCSTGAEVVSCVWQGGHVWGTSGQTNFALESMLTFFAAQAP